jgi:hypothetical protein
VRAACRRLPRHQRGGRSHVMNETAETAVIFVVILYEKNGDFLMIND